MNINELCKSKDFQSELSINRYYDILDILDSDVSGFEKNVKISSILTGRSEEDIKRLPLDEASKLFKSLEGLNKITINHHLPRTIRVKGWELCLIDDVDKITVSQFMDFNTLATGGELRETIDKLLSVFLIPKGKEYNKGYDIKQLQNDLREYLPFMTAQSVINFLMTKYLRSYERSLRYLVKRTKGDETVMKEIRENAVAVKEWIRQLQEL